jgi:predicted XRE-type DNA-binding protein
MTEKLEFVKGSGNVFRDFAHVAADVEQLKSILAAKIIGVLDDRKLSVRKAEGLTGVKASEFSRIRNAHLARFTVDRLMTILNRLDCRVEVKVTITPLPLGEARAEPGTYA